MKQRLLLVLLALFTSIGWMNADVVKLTIPKGATGSLSFTGENVLIGGDKKSSPFSINDLVKEEKKTVAISGDLVTLTINTKVTEVTVDGMEKLTSLVFSETAGSDLDNKLTFSNFSGKLKTLTVNKCGLTELPTTMPTFDEGATASFKNNELTDVRSITTDSKKVTYNFDGNKITEWPTLNTDSKATINYGSQSSAKIELPTAGTIVIANEWFDIYTALQDKYYSMVSASQLNYKWRKGTSGTFSETLIKKSDTYAGNFQFYSGGEYQSGTYQCEISPKTANAAPTYIVTVTVKPAQFKLRFNTNPEGGTLTVNRMKATSGTTSTSVSDNASVTKGEQLLLTAKNASGYSFSKYELKGLKATSTPNVYEVIGDGEAKELSVAAVFTKGSYKLTIDASSENGHYKVYNLTDNSEVANGATLPYGTLLKVVATPEEGYVPRVILNKVEFTTTANGNVYTFSDNDLKITTNSTLQILFDKTVEYTLKVQYLGGADNYKLVLNGEEYTDEYEESKGYYGEDGKLPKFPAGKLISLELKKSDATKNAPTIKKILLNSKAIATSTTKAQFEMPVDGATIMFETTKLASLEGKVTSKTGTDVQEFTYDGNPHAFEYNVVPSGLQGSFTVKYTREGAPDNYITTAPTAAGTYKVMIERAADASFATYNSTKGENAKEFKVTINPATPIITTAPTVTVSTTGDYVISNGKAQVGGKDVAGEWKILLESGAGTTTKPDADEGYDKKSHLVTVVFIPTDKTNLKGEVLSEAAKVQVAVKIGDTALKTYKVTATGIPSDMSLTFLNGSNEVKSGSTVPEGTKLTIKLTFPAGYTNVQLKENKANGDVFPQNPTATSPIEWSNYIVTAALDVTVSYAGTATSITPIIKKATVVNYDYDGTIHTNELFAAGQFDFENITDLEEAALQAKMTISYKDSKGNAVVAPVNAGEYTVVVTIPEVKTNKATYKAVTQEFEKLYVINKKALTVDEITVWPTDAVVGVGQDAKSAQFIGGAAPIEGTFHFVEEDKIGVPTTGSSYAVKFVPADATNYAEVLSTKTATVVVTDKRTLFIADMTNGSVTVLDQNGKALKDRQILDSSITSIKVTAIPNNGYVLGTLKVNNSTISSGSTYTLGSDNVTISATFIKQHTITLGAAPKGVKIASKPSSNIVNDGGSYTFTLNHVSGDKPTVTGTSNISVSTSGSTTTVKVTNIKANATLTIALAKPTAIKITTKPTLSKAGKPMGTIRVSGVNSSNECYYGDKITVTATANPGVEFSGWEDMTSTENPYEFEATKATYTFQAKYHGVLTGIESVDELNYYGGDGYIFVNCPAQGTLTIISMNGRAQKMSVSGQTRVTVPAGVYGIVLTSGSEVVRDKVVVR